MFSTAAKNCNRVLHVLVCMYVRAQPYVPSNIAGRLLYLLEQDRRQDAPTQRIRSNEKGSNGGAYGPVGQR